MPTHWNASNLLSPILIALIVTITITLILLTFAHQDEVKRLFQPRREKIDNEKDWNKTSTLLAEYTEGETQPIIVLIDIPDTPSTEQRRLHIKLKIPSGIDSFTISSTEETEGRVTKLSPPLYITDIQASCTVSTKLLPDGRHLFQLSNETRARTVEFYTTGTYSHYRNDGPFELHRFNLHITSTHAEKLLFEISHPTSITVQSRKDNAEYYSYAEGIRSTDSNPLVCKRLFFPQGDAKCRIIFGVHSERLIQSIYNPWLLVTLSLAFESIAILSIIQSTELPTISASHIHPLTPFFLGLSWIPAALDFISNSRKTYHSKNAKWRSPHSPLTITPIITYIIGFFYIIAILLTLPHNKEYLSTLAQVYIIFSCIHFLVYITLLTLVKISILPPTFCDQCEKLLILRSLPSALDTSTKHAYCRRCASGLNTRDPFTDALYKDLLAHASSLRYSLLNPDFRRIGGKLHKIKSPDHDSLLIDYLSESGLIDILKRQKFTGTLFSEESQIVRFGDGEVFAVSDPYCNTMLTFKGQHDSAFTFFVYSPDNQLLNALIVDLQLPRHIIYTNAAHDTVNVVWEQNISEKSRPSTTSELTKAMVVLASYKRRRRQTLPITLLREAGFLTTVSGGINALRMCVGEIDCFIDVSDGQPAYEALVYQLAETAGCVVTDSQGEKIDWASLIADLRVGKIRRQTIVAAATRDLHSQTLELLKRDSECNRKS